MCSEVLGGLPDRRDDKKHHGRGERHHASALLFVKLRPKADILKNSKNTLPSPSSEADNAFSLCG